MLDHWATVVATFKFFILSKKKKKKYRFKDYNLVIATFIYYISKVLLNDFYDLLLNTYF